MSKKKVKSEEPKNKRPISLNILEIAKRLQKIEEISDTPYTLPTASADTKGGVKVGNGLSMTGEVLSADPVDASHVMMSDGVTSVEDRLTANTIDARTRVDISSYTSTNPYTCPADGYAVLYANTSGQSGRIASGDIVLLILSGQAGSVFVKKGMSIYPLLTNGATAYFNPLS